jgi:HlyD family secretion protein
MSLPPQTLRALRPLQARPGEIQEILSAPPPLLTQVGLLVVLGGVLLALLVLGGVRYPELVPGKLAVVSARPPISVVANADGRVVRFFVEDRAPVKARQPILLLDNPAQLKAIEQAQQASEALRKAVDSPLPSALPPLLQLGELQSDYAAAVRLSEELEAYLRTRPFQARIEAVQRSIQGQAGLRGALRQQQQLLDQSASLAASALQRQEQLRQVAGLSSSADIDDARGAWLAAQARRRELDATLARSKIEGNDAAQLLAQLQQEDWDREASLRRGLREALDRVLAGVARWEHQFLLRAPIDGRLAFHEVWAPDQPVRRGQEVFFVVPQGEQLLGRTTVPQRGFGRVRPGQPVRVKLDAFPFDHFGLVLGVVDSISLNARQEGAMLTVRFPDGLRTSTGRSLPFTQGMTAQAEIITEDLSLLERFLTPLRGLRSGGLR